MRIEKKGFSLVELLVALSVLAILAAIIVPKFFATKEEATDAAAAATANELTHVYGDWRASGGTITGTAPTIAGVLNVLCSPSAVSPTTPVSSGDSQIYDSGTSSTIRFNAPIDLVLPASNDASAAIGYDGMFLTFNATTGIFTGISQQTAIASGNPPSTYAQAAVDYTWEGNGTYVAGSGFPGNGHGVSR